MTILHLDAEEVHRRLPILAAVEALEEALRSGVDPDEREFGRLKNEWTLLPLRVRGFERVQLHADLTILAKLACALARARTVPVAA